MRNPFLKLAAVLTVAAVATGGAQSLRAERLTIAEGVGPALTSVGPLAFGENGVLYASDPMAATIYAVDLGAAATGGAAGTKDVAGIDAKIAAMLGTDAASITIADLVVHPTTRNSFVAVMRGQGASAQPALFRVDGAGAVTLVPLDDATFTSVTLPNAPDATPNARRNNRASSVTDLAFSNGRLFVAGLSNEEFASKLWSVAYPFSSADRGTSVEIFHGNHGQLETRSPVNAFVPYVIDGTPHLIASYTCTSLVKFEVANLQPGQKILGTTIAELGNRNRPLDMIVYSKGGAEYILMANNSRGVMKIPTASFASAAAISTPVETETGGVPFETVASMTGILQLDKLDAERSIVIAQDDTGLTLKVVVLP